MTWLLNPVVGSFALIGLAFFVAGFHGSLRGGTESMFGAIVALWRGEVKGGRE